MPTHIADIPRPMYAWVRDSYLYDDPARDNEWSECLIYGISALPARAWGLSALMRNGAIFQHLPVTAFSTTPTSDHTHALEQLQVWSCYGYEFAAHEYGALAELPIRAYLGNGAWESGRYWFTAAPYDDLYSRTPDQHKHFNFVWLSCGALASLPGNRMLFEDASFTTEVPTDGRPGYKVNTRYFYPEDSTQKFDATITDTAG